MTISPQPTGVPSGIGFGATPPLPGSITRGAILLQTYNHNSAPHIPVDVSPYAALLLIYKVSSLVPPTFATLGLSYDNGIARLAYFNRHDLSGSGGGLVWRTLPIEGENADAVNPAAIQETISLYGLGHELATYGIGWQDTADDYFDGTLLRASIASAAGGGNDLGRSHLFEGPATVSAFIGGGMSASAGYVTGYGVDDAVNPLFVFPLLANGDNSASNAVTVQLPATQIDWQIYVAAGATEPLHLSVTGAPRA